MILTVDESLSRLNIPVAKFILARSADQAVGWSKKFPVFLKLVSEKVTHKSDVGGVVKASGPDEARKAFNDFRDFAIKNRLPFKGVIVQEFVSGVELVLGIKYDLSFGHVILFGLGGVFVEVLKDVAFRVCPITKKDAVQMMLELKGGVLLEGVRGKRPVDKAALADVMVKFSHLPQKLPEIEELDVNPLMADGEKIKAVDARFVLRDSTELGE